MRNAFSGYTYQKHITILLLSIIDFIKDKKLSPQKVAKLSDGNSSCLAEVQVFDI